LQKIVKVFAYCDFVIAKSSVLPLKNGKGKKANGEMAVAFWRVLAPPNAPPRFGLLILGSTEHTTTKQFMKVADGKAKFTALPSVMLEHIKSGHNTHLYNNSDLVFKLLF